ncbi:MAG: hypothetical protein MK116_10835 [Phycisphaerales bacterium]|nr:hypothetical protein [Phycisphaerales bacterium]
MHRLLIFLAAGCLLAGCASTTHVKAGQHDQFRDALVDSCRAIQASDFAAARRHLDHANDLTGDLEQAGKVADLELVLVGAEAMNSGQPEVAARSWLAIRDRSLKQQLVALARAEGIDIVALSAASSQEVSR